MQRHTKFLFESCLKWHPRELKGKSYYPCLDCGNRRMFMNHRHVSTTLKTNHRLKHLTTVKITTITKFPSIITTSNITTTARTRTAITLCGMNDENGNIQITGIIPFACMFCKPTFHAFFL